MKYRGVNYDTISIYGRIKIPQRTCGECGGRFFVDRGDGNSAYCEYCRDIVNKKKLKINVEKPKVIFHLPILENRLLYKVIPKSLREEIYKRDGYKCVYCNEDLCCNNKYLDHFLPFAAGGEETIENLYTSCRKCNSLKGTKVFKNIEEVRVWLKRKRKKT